MNKYNKIYRTDYVIEEASVYYYVFSPKGWFVLSLCAHPRRETFTVLEDQLDLVVSFPFEENAIEANLYRLDRRRTADRQEAMHIDHLMRVFIESGDTAGRKASVEIIPSYRTIE